MLSEWTQSSQYSARVELSSPGVHSSISMFPATDTSPTNAATLLTTTQSMCYLQPFSSLSS